MLEVEESDIVSALPPSLGGTWTAVSEAVKVRDVMLSQVDQLLSAKEDKRTAVDFLKNSLREYEERGFIAPPIGLVEEGWEEGGEEKRRDDKEEGRRDDSEEVRPPWTVER